MRIVRIQFLLPSEADALIELQVTVASLVLAVIVFVCMRYIRCLWTSHTPKASAAPSVEEGNADDNGNGIGLLMLFPRLPPLHEVTTTLERRLPAILQPKLGGEGGTIGPVFFREHIVMREMFQNQSYRASSPRSTQSSHRGEQSPLSRREPSRTVSVPSAVSESFARLPMSRNASPTVQEDGRNSSRKRVGQRNADTAEATTVVDAPAVRRDDNRRIFGSLGRVPVKCSDVAPTQDTVRNGSDWKWLAQQKAAQLMNAPSTLSVVHGVCDVRYIKVYDNGDEGQSGGDGNHCGGILLRVRSRAITASALLQLVVKCGLIQYTTTSPPVFSSNINNNGSDSSNYNEPSTAVRSKDDSHECTDHVGEGDTDPRKHEHTSACVFLFDSHTLTGRLLRGLFGFTAVVLHALHTVFALLIKYVARGSGEDINSDSAGGQVRLFISPFCSKILLQSAADCMNEWIELRAAGSPEVCVSDIAIALLLGAMRRQRVKHRRRLTLRQKAVLTGNRGALPEALSRTLLRCCRFLERCCAISCYLAGSPRLVGERIRHPLHPRPHERVAETMFTAVVEVETMSLPEYGDTNPPNPKDWVERVLKCTECRLLTAGTCRQPLRTSMDIVTYSGMRDRATSCHFCCEQMEALYCIEPLYHFPACLPVVESSPPVQCHAITECGDALYQTVWLPVKECPGDEFLEDLAEELLVMTKNILKMCTDDVLEVLRLTHGR
ncbi:hypothetical protein DPX39_110111200 [Trypanosoma brucei equiperdum]|uniref:Uncharacterized protein n=1 Tax=Trypanosoma brucei equiperdum TaxID=630700 RepID=A0A3L6KUZ6_9TRYP|nr:hypothetical protein DPX39_110111200 [Trypanosoma brucei equiperdum]